MNNICIGKIVKTIGIKGEVKVIPQTDNISRFKSLKSFFIDESELEIESVSLRNGFVAIKMKNYDTIEQVQKFINKHLFIKREDAVKLKKNQYFIVDLIGSKLIFENNDIGIITDIENYGANDIIVYKHSGKEFRVPFLLDIFEKIDIENKVLMVKPNFNDFIV